ncbi:MAG: DUF4124 domain-containing protein [Gammaproteobacteria bacterium]
MQKILTEIFTSILLLLVSNILCSGEIYKWTDSDGNIHYSDHPQNTAKKIKVQQQHKSHKENLASSQKRDRFLEVYKEDRQEKSSKKASARAEKIAQKEKCSEAKKSFQQYQTAGYLYKLDKEGERVILDDKEHAIAVKSAEHAVEQYCS